jgi:hypothetical protein
MESIAQPADVRAYAVGYSEVYINASIDALQIDKPMAE